MKTLLNELGEQLNKHSVIWGLGGSYMLSYYNIGNDVNDIDIIISEQDAITVDNVLSTFADKKPTKCMEPFRTKHFFNYSYKNTPIDIMGGFQISHKTGVYTLDFDHDSITGHHYIDQVPIPLSSLEDWYILYSLIPGKQYKADLIESYWKDYTLRNPSLLEKSLKQPLPNNLREKIHFLMNKS